MNKARNFTLKYFEIIERNLHVENVDGEEPIFIPERIDDYSLKNLSDEIDDLLRSTEVIDAIYNMESYCKENEDIITTGVGYCEKDFSNFVKLGLLLGNKVVLWEALLPGILHSNEKVDLVYLGRYVYSVLSLKKLAIEGGLVFLPHPEIWNDRTRYYMKSISGISGITGEFLGFINAWSLLQDGFQLHPYLMATVGNSTYELHKNFLCNNKYFSKNKLDLHADLYDIFRYDKFNYLPDIRLSDFYKILNSNQERYTQFKSLLFQEIQKPDDISDVERRQYLNNLFSNLHRGIEKQNRDVITNKINNAKAISGSVGTIGSLTAAAISLDSTATIISLFSGVFCAIPTLMSLLQSLSVKPSVNVIYQVFNEIKDKNIENRINDKRIEQYKKKINIPERYIE